MFRESENYCSTGGDGAKLDGNDFTNDALINAGSLVEDYEHKLMGVVSLDGLCAIK